MKKGKYLLCILLISLVFISCDKNNKKINEIKSVNNKEIIVEVNDDISEPIKAKESNEIVYGSDSDLKAQAKKEGISKKEMREILDDLTKFGAEKYGITIEEYIARTKTNNTTVLEEWKIAAEFMNMSIKEIYKYEKQSMEGKTDKEKATLAGMSNALSEVEKLNLDSGIVDSEELLGIYGNTSGEIREVEGDFKELFYYNVDEILSEDEDEYSIAVEYNSKDNIEIIKKYYIELIENTEGYMLLAPKGVPEVMIQGSFNGMSVYIEIVGNENATYVSCYLDKVN